MFFKKSRLKLGNFELKLDLALLEKVQIETDDDVDDDGVIKEAVTKVVENKVWPFLLQCGNSSFFSATQILREIDFGL